MILSADSIKSLCVFEPKVLGEASGLHITKYNALIEPFSEEQSSHGLSWGLSCCGYDVRIKQHVTLYPVTLWNLFLNAIGIARPSFILASTIEHVNIPDWLCATLLDKSTWARQGLAVQTTIVEPGFKGWITLELSNHGNKVLNIAAGTPIGQMVFHKLDMQTSKVYKGKYQNQKNDVQIALFS